MSRERVDVLVAGAGPVGLFLACELHRRGRTCAVVERSAAPSTHSKALAIMPKTLGLFERAGIAGEFLGEINRVRSIRFHTPHRSAAVSFSKLRTPFPFVAILPQWQTEQLLTARLHSLGGSVRYGHTLEGFESRDGGVRAVIGGEEPYAVDAAYLAGCDGAHSTVRERAGIAFPGVSYREEALLADVAISTDVPQDEALVHIDRHGLFTMFPISHEVRRVVIVSPREALPQSPSPAWLQEKIDRCAGAHTYATEILWSNTFRVHRRLANRLRQGRIAIAGDAAHLHSPVGGQGMNTGLHDAWALAEALCSALTGDASALDAYERERLSEARKVVRRTDFLTRALAHPHAAMSIGREFLAPYVIGVPLLRERVVRSLLTA